MSDIPPAPSSLCATAGDWRGALAPVRRRAGVAARSLLGTNTHVLQPGQRIVLASACSVGVSFFAHWGQVTVIKPRSGEICRDRSTPKPRRVAAASPQAACHGRVTPARYVAWVPRVVLLSSIAGFVTS